MIFHNREDGRPGEFFSWAELTVTGKPFGNKPTGSARLNLVVFTQNCLDPLRRFIDRPIRVTSGYRSEAVNRAVGGHPLSYHRRGEAADIKAEGLSAPELMAAVVELAGLDDARPYFGPISGLRQQQVRWVFDQAIAYAPTRGGHLHLQLRVSRESENRRKKLWAPTGGGYEDYRLRS